MDQRRTIAGTTARLIAVVGVIGLCVAGFAGLIERTGDRADGASTHMASAIEPIAIFDEQDGADEVAGKKVDARSAADRSLALASTPESDNSLEGVLSDEALADPAPTMRPTRTLAIGASVLGSSLLQDDAAPAATATAVPATPVPATATVVPPTPVPAPTTVPATATAIPSTPVPVPAPTPVPATATVVPPTAVPVAPTAVAAAGTSYEQRGRRVLNQISYNWQALGYSISFHPPRPGYRGLTYPYENRIEIYVDPTMSDAQLAHVIAHEIGHAVDVVRNSGADRQDWLAARGFAASTQWWAGDGVSDFASGSGDFAECFASWQVGSPSYSRLNGNCSGTSGVVARLAGG